MSFDWCTRRCKLLAHPTGEESEGEKREGHGNSFIFHLKPAAIRKERGKREEWGVEEKQAEAD